MLLLDSSRVPVGDSGSFLVDDHADAGVAWLVDPIVLVPETAPGVRDFCLLRYQDAGTGGGLLSFALRIGPVDGPTQDAITATSAGRRVQPAIVRSFHARLRVRSPETSGGEHLTAWTDGQIAEGGAVRFGMTFDGVDMQILAALLDAAPAPAGTSPIEVEGVIAIAGRAGAMPVVASISPVALSAAIRARSATTTGDVFPEDVLAEAGALALQEDPSTGTWKRTDDGRAPLDTHTVLREVARRALALIAIDVGPASPEQPTRWQLLPDDRLPGSADLNLAAYRGAVLRVPVRWSMTDFLASLSPEQREKALPTIGDADPLHPVTVHVASSIPFDPRFVTGVDVTLRFRGVTGAFQTQTLHVDANAALADASIVHNRFLPFTLERHLAVMVAGPPGGWARVRQLPYEASGRLVAIDPAAAQTTFVPVAVDDDVFRAASAVAITFRGDATPVEGAPPLAKVELTRAAPAATVAIDGAGRALWAKVEAIAPVDPAPNAAPTAVSAPARLVIRDGVVNGRIDVMPSDLMSLEPVPVTLRRAMAATETRFPYLAVSVRAPENADAFVLLEGGERAWSVFRADPFQAPRFQYRAEWVLHDDRPAQPGEMASGAITTGPWRDAAPPLLIIDPDAESAP